MLPYHQLHQPHAGVLSPRIFSGGKPLVRMHWNHWLNVLEDQLDKYLTCLNHCITKKFHLKLIDSRVEKLPRQGANLGPNPRKDPHVSSPP